MHTARGRDLDKGRECGMDNASDNYVLGRDIFGSVRLDASHLLWRLHHGYVLHPRIPVHEGMKIADIGTGTGIWLLDAADQLPASVQLDGYDISDRQFPPRMTWPKNVTLQVMDSLRDPPEHLIGQYDVVHLRFWCCIVRRGDPTALIRHAKSLLKPGGYIQWEDGDVFHNVIRGAQAESFARTMNKLFAITDFDLSWIANIPDFLKQEGLQVLEHIHSTFRPSLEPLCTNTYLAGHFEFFETCRGLLGQHDVPSKADLEAALQELSWDIKRGGGAYHWTPVSVLARLAKET